MLTVMIIPTGIGCEIGGHAGDATPAARLLGQVSDKLILHPNVVNASDINEMPSNALYVEGSMLDSFLEGGIHLQEVKSNRILVVVNPDPANETINAVSAARATLGIDAKIEVLKIPLHMTGCLSEKTGEAIGQIMGQWQLVAQLANRNDFDAVAIATSIIVDEKTKKQYWKDGGVNPWGKAEAELSRYVSKRLSKPVAHAPVEDSDTTDPDYNTIVDPRMAAEAVSTAYLFCVLKGLHKAPRIAPNDYTKICSSNIISGNEVDCLVSPYGCWGPPHEACRMKNIPVISVRENKCIFDLPQSHCTIYVENYLEAAGVIAAMEAGITLDSVRRPLKKTIVKE